MIPPLPVYSFRMLPLPSRTVVCYEVCEAGLWCHHHLPKHDYYTLPINDHNYSRQYKIHREEKFYNPASNAIQLVARDWLIEEGLLTTEPDTDNFIEAVWEAIAEGQRLHEHVHRGVHHA